MTRILIAEGEPLISLFLQRGLRANGYRSRVVRSPHAAVELAGSGDFALHIVDSRFLGDDDVAALTRLRLTPPVPPLLVLGARGDPVVEALLQTPPAERLDKPFRFGQLIARVRDLLDGAGVGQPTVLRVGQSTLDLDSRRLTIGGESHELSATEFALAEALFRHAGRDVTFEQLVRQTTLPLDDIGAVALEADFQRLCERLGSELEKIVGLVGYRLRDNGEF